MIDPQKVLFLVGYIRILNREISVAETELFSKPAHRCCSPNNSFCHCHQKKGKFVLLNDTSRAHWLSYHWLLDIKHTVIVTYFFRGNSLSLYRLLFSIRDLLYALSRRQDRTSCGPLVGIGNSPNCKCIRCAGLIRWFKPLKVGALPLELCPAPLPEGNLVVENVYSITSLTSHLSRSTTPLYRPLHLGPKRSPITIS